MTLSVTFGEDHSDYVDLSLTTSPHPNGYYKLSNINPPQNGSSPGCEASASDLNCTTGELAGGSFSATFSVSPAYPQPSINDVLVGYNDYYSEAITLCGPGTNKILERRMLYMHRTVSDQVYGSSCAQLGVAGLRFAPRGKSGAGEPVIWDGPDRATTVEQNAAKLSCPSMELTPRDWDYLDCSTPVPSGDTQQNWPVVLPAQSPLKIDEVDFYTPKYLANPKMEAEATLGGTTLKLPRTGLREIAAGSGFKLTATHLSFTGDIPPQAVGATRLEITWKVTTDAGQVNSNSSHAVFVTGGEYVAPKAGTPGATTTFFNGPYLSVVALGAEAHPGAASTAVRAAAIWKDVFQPREVPLINLDPATGAVSLLGHETYKYFGDQYPTEVGLWNDFASCPELLAFLTHPDDGHCGDWAWFMEQILAYEGIAAKDIVVGSVPGFDPGPPPYGYPAFGHNFMLVGPWRFNRSITPGERRNGGWLLNPFGWSNAISSHGSLLTTDSTGFSYNPRGKPIAQGPVSHPLGMFQTGDHEIVEVGGAYFDPSYGMPHTGTNGYPTISAWEDEALSGFAVLLIEKPVTSLSQRVYVPAPYYGRDRLASICRQYTCRLVATPYKVGGYPDSAGFPNVAGASASVPVACAAGRRECSFSVEVDVSGVAAAAARVTVIGLRRVLVRGGRAVMIRVVLNAQGRALRRRHPRGLPATLTVRDSGRSISRVGVTFR